MKKAACFSNNPLDSTINLEKSACFFHFAASPNRTWALSPATPYHVTQRTKHRIKTVGGAYGGRTHIIRVKAEYPTVKRKRYTTALSVSHVNRRYCVILSVSKSTNTCFVLNIIDCCSICNSKRKLRRSIDNWYCLKE